MRDALETRPDAPPDARVADCPHRPPCPGCPRFGDPAPPAAALRRLGELASAQGLAPPRVQGVPASGHRHRARLMVRGRAGSPKIGLFQEGSHRIVDIPRCSVHHPLVNEVAAAARRAIRACHAPPYADRPHAGLVRALQVVVARAEGSAQVVLVANEARPSPASRALLAALARECGARLHSLFWNGNPERTNTILGPSFEHVSGPGAVREEIGGAGVHFPPGAFGQSHLPLADRLVAGVAARVPDGARVLELYAGCGALGLGWLPRIAHWSANELSPHGLAGLQLGLAERTEPERARAELLPGPAEGEVARLAQADVVVADPPRRGLAAAWTAALAERPPARFVYVSCGLASFLRDAEQLLAGGRLRLAALEAFDLFPYTEHLETLAVFEPR